MTERRFAPVRSMTRGLSLASRPRWAAILDLPQRQAAQCLLYDSSALSIIRGYEEGQERPWPNRTGYGRGRFPLADAHSPRSGLCLFRGRTRPAIGSAPDDPRGAADRGQHRQAT
jgi:hypothetical protein